MSCSVVGGFLLVFFPFVQGTDRQGEKGDRLGRWVGRYINTYTYLYIPTRIYILMVSHVSRRLT